MPQSTPQDCVTVIHISNLHCSSCVQTINDRLSSLTPEPISIITSIVLQTVTVNHSQEIPPRALRVALLDAGFDVVEDVSGEQRAHPLRRRQKHVDQCTICQENEASRHPAYTQVEVALDPVLAQREKASPCRIVFSVSGMTCSSCSNTITDMVSRIPRVSDITVNPIDGSATAIIETIDLVDVVQNAIEDCGFGARVVDVDPIGANARQETRRTISIRVNGMFCSNCPPKVMSAIDSFGEGVTVIKPLTTITDPILTLSYQPELPSLSIRTIIASIANSNATPFQVTVFHPPTLEELSRAMQFREQRHLLYRLCFSFLTAIPTFIIGIVYMTLVREGNVIKSFLMEPMWIGNVSRSEWALFFMATPVMFYSAGVFHRRSIKEIYALWKQESTTPYLKRFIRFGSMNLLVSTGVSVAYFASVGLLALAAQSPTRLMGDSTTYFDSVVFLTMFLLAGRFLEAYSKVRTADAISALSSLRPAHALLLVPEPSKARPASESLAYDDLEKGDPDGLLASLSTPPGSHVVQIPVDQLEVGDVVRVLNGASPPADGIVLPGEFGAFDESSLTGESKLIRKQEGDRVFLGTFNRGQTVHIKVEEIGGRTMLDNIVKVVREGQTRRAPIERIADLITGYFVPVVTLLAILTWLIWLGLGLSGTLPADYLDIDIGGWPVWSLQFAIAVFVVACPCGIGLAAPTALLVGLGLAAKYGILARGGGEAFQEMSQLDIVVFDKTGTLTEGGDPRVSDFELAPSNTWETSKILGIASEIESASSHPLAIAIREFCRNSVHFSGSEFEETAGRGVKAVFQELHCTAVIGNEAWMQEHGVTVDDTLLHFLETWKSEAKSVILLAVKELHHASYNLAAIFAVEDHLRPEASDVVRSLQEKGIGTWMISGDNFTTASAVAKAVGIPAGNVIAGVLPHEKSQKIEQLQLNGSQSPNAHTARNTRIKPRTVVAMVGDGINDAPALTVADVGIAIGSGSDVAVSSASFVLLSSDLRSLITLHDLSGRIINRVKFNFLWAIIYNLIALPVAAGVIYPAGHARLNPVWASLAMALSSVSVVCSSLLLKFYREPSGSRKSTK